MKKTNIKFFLTFILVLSFFPIICYSKNCANSTDNCIETYNDETYYPIKNRSFSLYIYFQNKHHYTFD